MKKYTKEQILIAAEIGEVMERERKLRKHNVVCCA